MAKNKIRVLVIDDEIAFINTLKSLIELQPEKNLEIAGFARSVSEALEKIDELEPDLLFLDIKLPDGTGFNVIERCSRNDFKIIFITAFNQYAVEAFKHSAVDYLLKPILSKDLWDAVLKVEKDLQKREQELKLSILIDNINQLNSDQKKLVLREGSNLHVIRIQYIKWLEAKGSYTEFFIEDEKPILVCHHLKDYESMLENCGFVRTHRSFLVNVNKIKRFDKSEGGSIYLEDGNQLPVSYKKKEKLCKLLEDL